MLLCFSQAGHECTGEGMEFAHGNGGTLRQHSFCVAFHPGDSQAQLEPGDTPFQIV